ncbi:MAG: carboxypeptidase M32 [Candidatus Eiseniibacteriota bacterium]
MTTGNATMKTLIENWREFEDVKKAASLLEWDQETQMPGEGAEARGQQLATLAGVAHEKLVAPAFRRALSAAAKSGRLPARESAMIREARRDHLRAVKIPADLVKELARAEAAGLAAWRGAYRSNRWRDFAGRLATVVRLKRRLADVIGYRDVPYDALLDDYEPGATVRRLDPLFAEVRETSVALVQKIRRSRRRPDRRIVTRLFPEAAQLTFSREVVEKMGFDFARGRLDLSMHPFCSGFGVRDVRLTTRVDEHDLRVCLYGVIHEAGHGMYEQGFDPRLMRTPLGHAVSLGVHESQSRMWENTIGRSLPFWTHFLPKLRKAFPQATRGVKLADLHFALNEVVPSFIRVEADEVTYNLHVILRYEIEKGLCDGSIQTKDLPEVWNRKMKDLLGVVPRRDSEGVLQDIHWATGLFGYFPTYSLGNLYAAQLWERMRRDIRGIDGKIARGDFAPVLGWLRRKVHAPGRTYPAAELIRRATGREPSTAPFVAYVTSKYGALYDL